MLLGKSRKLKTGKYSVNTALSLKYAATCSLQHVTCTKKKRTCHNLSCIQHTRQLCVCIYREEEQRIMSVWRICPSLKWCNPSTNRSRLGQLIVKTIIVLHHSRHTVTQIHRHSVTRDEITLCAHYKTTVNRQSSQ